LELVVAKEDRAFVQAFDTQGGRPLLKPTSENGKSLSMEFLTFDRAS